ncbi:OmpA family protein [Oceanobacillus timonensis]|uniref:OmpA family protein n=1 Tax=Oceanobacillus timonensis TaxID=1926285 RepID=UPI0009BC49D5|nr:OmpA family protein [Oceanobacillus timonensis]
MKKIWLVLFSVSLLAACNNEEAEDEPPEQTQKTEVSETEDKDVEENIEEQQEQAASEETLEDTDPVMIEHDMWHFKDETAYDIHAEVGPIIREGEYAILPFMLDSNSDIEVTFKDLFDGGLSTGEGIASEQGYDIRLLDSQENTASHIAVQQLEDSNDAALQTFIGEGSGNQQMTIGKEHEPTRYFAVFAAPESDVVHAMFTGEVGIVEDIPVIDRKDEDMSTLQEYDAILEQHEDNEEEMLKEENIEEVVPTVQEIIEKELVSSQQDQLTGDLEGIDARVEPFESYRESVETTVSRIDEIEHSTLILSSDVLFDSDSSDLTEEADKELEAAIEELAGADGGELNIVGHTDDENTEDYNQTLSEERAESVYEQLEELTDLEGFDEVTTEGESFREPIADNNTEEGQAQNRRVELHFTPPAEEIMIESEEELPEALGEEADYPETVQTRYGEIEIQSIRRVNDLFIGRVRVRPNDEGDSDYDALTQTAGIGARGWHADDAGNYNQWSVYPVTLIHGNQRYYPIDYYLTPLEGSFVDEKIEDAEDDVNFIVPLADRNITDAGRLGEDGFYTATIVWPAFDAEEVTVDLPHSDVFSDHEGAIEITAPWRIMNVPVEESADEDDLDHDSKEAAGGEGS